MKAEAFASAHTVRRVCGIGSGCLAAMKAEAFASAHPMGGRTSPERTPHDHAAMKAEAFASAHLNMSVTE